MHTILEYGVRLGVIEANPFDGVARLPTRARDIYVADEAAFAHYRNRPTVEDDQGNRFLGPWGQSRRT